MRFRLRTLLILLAVLPPLVGFVIPALVRSSSNDKTDRLMSEFLAGPPAYTHLSIWLPVIAVLGLVWLCTRRAAQRVPTFKK